MEQVTVSPTSPSMSRLVLETPIFLLYLHLGLGISEKKNSTEDGIDKKNGLFQWKSCSSEEQKTLRILFWTFLRKIKCPEFHTEQQKSRLTLGILFWTSPQKRKKQLRNCMEQIKKQTFRILFWIVSPTSGLFWIPCSPCFESVHMITSHSLGQTACAYQHTKSVHTSKKTCFSLR